jgi:hypothetical protein
VARGRVEGGTTEIWTDVQVWGVNQKKETSPEGNVGNVGVVRNDEWDGREGCGDTRMRGRRSTEVSSINCTGRCTIHRKRRIDTCSKQHGSTSSPLKFETRSTRIKPAFLPFRCSGGDPYSALRPSLPQTSRALVACEAADLAPLNFRRRYQNDTYNSTVRSRRYALLTAWNSAYSV